LFFGESAAADPYGQILVKAGDREQELLVEMDLNLVKESRKFPFYLKDRRPSHYTLSKETESIK
jgi:5-aminopentanamidase